MEKLDFNNTNKLWKAIIGTNHFSIEILNLGVALIICTETILRYVFTKDMSTYEEYLIPIAFWMYMLGGINGSIEKSHISADFLSAYMKEGMRKDLLILTREFLTVVLSAIFTFWAFKSVIWYIQIGQKSPVWHVPAWMAYSSIFVGMLFMTIFGLKHFMHDSKQFIGKKYFIKPQINENERSGGRI